jgi:hypothetical protein
VQYALLIYGSGEGWEQLTKEEQDAQSQEYMALGQRSETRGGADLGDLANSTTVRVNDGDTLTTDGPFAETKEVLGGYYIVDVKDLDRALELAAQIPSARYGTVEVRPIDVM